METLERVRELDIVCAGSQAELVHFSLSTMDHEDNLHKIEKMATVLGLEPDELRKYVQFKLCLREAIQIELIAQYFGFNFSSFEKYVNDHLDELMLQREREELVLDSDPVFPFERRGARLEDSQEEAGNFANNGF